MADIGITTTYTMKLTTEELSLVLRALGNRLISDAEVAQAEALGLRLTEIRGKVMKTQLEHAQRILDSVDANVEHRVQRQDREARWDTIERFRDMQDAKRYLAAVVNAKPQPSIAENGKGGSYWDSDADQRIFLRIFTVKEQ